MGGTQSWVSCDATYPTPDPVYAESSLNKKLENGDPIIAVIMFLTTLFGLLLLTVVVHCGIIALRGLRHRRAHLRHQRMLQPQQRQQHEVDSGGHHHLAVPSVAVVLHPDSGAAGDGGEVDDGETSSTSSMTSSSSESSLDSTTARIAAQVASRRRQSRFMLPADPGDPPARPTDAGFGGSGGFLVPPSTHAPNGGYANRGFDSRFDV